MVIVSKGANKCFDCTLRLLHTNSKGLQLTLGIMGNSQISQNDLFLLDLPDLKKTLFTTALLWNAGAMSCPSISVTGLETLPLEL